MSRDTSADDLRLAALRSYQILDTPAEDGFDDAVALVRTVCCVPIALVSLIDADRQWFKAKSGVTLCETSLDTSVCALAITQNDLFVIPDLTQDPRTADMSLVTGEAALRFYAGAPLVTSAGIAIGSLCAIDTEPRPDGLTADQENALRALARQVIAAIELRGAVSSRDVALAEQDRRQRQAAAAAATLDAVLRAQQQVLEAGGDFQASLRALAGAALDAIDPADGVMIEMREGDRLSVHMAVGTLAHRVGLPVPLDGSLSGRAIRERTTLVSSDTSGDSRVHPGIANDLGVRAAVIVPLVRRGEAFGALVIHAREPHSFRSRHILIAQMFASLIAGSYTESAEDAALRSVEDAEARYSHIIDSAIDSAIIAVDADGIVTSWNKGSENLFGWTEAEMIGQSLSRIFTPQDVADGKVAAEFDTADQRGRAPDERWHVRKDGSRFYAHGAVTPLVDGSGGFVKSLRNITAEHVTREALAVSRERLDVALDTGLIAFFDWDLTANRIRGEARAAAFYGVDPVQFVAGMPPELFSANVHPADRDRLTRSTLAALATCADYTESFRIITGRDVRWLLARGSCIEEHGGHPLRYVVTAVDVTVQREAEERLRLSSERLELATRAARLGSFDYLPPTGKLDWDDRCRALFGLSPGAPVTYEGAFLAGLHPADRDRAAAAVAAALDPSGDGSFGIEYRTIGIEDGVERHVAASGLAFFDGRVPVRLVGTVLDVTESRLEQARQLETQERYRLAVRATADAVWDWDLVRDQVFWNESLTDNYGHRLIDGLSNGAWWLDHIHPDDRTRVSDDIHAIIDSGQSDWSDEYCFQRADGTYADVRDRGFVLRDAAGAAIRMIGAMLDQTERKQTERALEEANSDLEEEVEVRTRERDQIWQATPDLLCVANGDGFFLELNPAWELTLGWTTAELRAQRFYAFIHPDDHDKTAAAMTQLAQGHVVNEFENRYLTKAGDARWFSWNAVPRDGLIYAVIRDVTEAHRQAAALARAEEQLRQSQKMEAVGQLTGGLAHDFNNLLAGISGSIEMMQLRMKQGRIADIDRYLTAAGGATRRAAALTHRLLAFSRRQTLSPSTVDVNRLVAGMEELVLRTVGPEIAIATVGAPDLWRTQVDPNQLENALLNLCINARDAMPGGGALTIETANRRLDEAGATERGLAAGSYVSLCVSDTGTGMSKEVIERAFDPFYTTKPLGQGTGLGLSMIYGFARQSGGQVRIHSVPGEGTTVCLYLPRHIGDDEIATEHVAAPIERAGVGETVLVVDDEPTVRMLVVDALQELGYAAIEAADGAEGLRIVETGTRIDLIVTDVGLPGGMNGRQLAEAARVARPDLKILFITGYAENAVLNHGHLEPGMEILTKPFAMETLAQRMRAILKAPR